MGLWGGGWRGRLGCLEEWRVGVVGILGEGFGEVERHVIG
jgi:hypothetical protein